MFPKDIHGLNDPRVWDTSVAFHHLQKLGYAETKRTAERRLHEWRVLPAALTPEDIRDEKGESPVLQTLEWEIEEARKQRKTVLFVQSFPLPDDAPCLHANDARGARFWIPVSSLSNRNVEAALLNLQSYLNRSLVIFPHGEIVGTCRRIKPLSTLSFGLLAYATQAEVFRNVVSHGREKAGDENSLSHLDRLEAESIYILREAVAEADNPVMLYSIGKDSAVMLHLARKAFFPAPLPFPLLHVDTRWKFQDMYRFRDAVARESNIKLEVHINPEAIAKDINPFDHGSTLHTDITKTEGLKQALDARGYDVIFGGARRDEEKSRAKERIFSFRTATHHWDPKHQRPELWNLYNTRKSKGESIRVFPLSNWTELDIWQYIYRENIPIVPLYFAKERPVVEREGLLLLVDDARMPLLPGETIQRRKVRFRTLGCYPLTGAVESDAETVSDIVLELLNATTSERQGRAIDADSAASMERKKQEGYF